MSVFYLALLLALMWNLVSVFCDIRKSAGFRRTPVLDFFFTIVGLIALAAVCGGAA